MASLSGCRRQSVTVFRQMLLNSSYLSFPPPWQLTFSSQMQFVHFPPTSKQKVLEKRRKKKETLGQPLAFNPV